MIKSLKILPAKFFETETGRVPVKEWIQKQSIENKKRIGREVLNVEIGWPIGMPLCRSIQGHKGLWEIRIDLLDGKIGRIFFCVQDEQMILLHGFIKKTQKTPANEIAIAVKRMKGLMP